MTVRPTTRPVDRGDQRSHLSAGWVPLVLAISFAVPNLLWIWGDHRVWSFDQSWYGEVTSELWFILKADTANWGAAMAHAMPSKPPLLVWLSQFVVPLGHVFGDVDRALLAFIVLQQVLSLVFLWAALRDLGLSVLACAVAVLCFMGAPLSVGLTHQFFVEPLQATIVTGSLWLAVRASRCTPLLTAALLLLLLALSLATKTTTFLYCAFFWLISGVGLLRRIRTPHVRRLSAIGVLVLAVALSAFGLTLFWYKVNLSEVLEHVRLSTGQDALLYGRTGSFIDKVLEWYDLGAVATTIYPGLLALSLLGSVPLVGFFLRRRGLHDPRVAILLAALGHILVVIAILAAQPNEETRFLLPLVVDVAVVAGILADLNRVVAACACLALGLQTVLVNAQAAGYPVAFAKSTWLLPIQTDRSDRKAADGILDATCSQADAWRMNIIGPEFPQMNANSMSYLAAKRRLDVGFRCSYTSFGYAAKDVAASLRRIDDMNVKYVVLPSASRMPPVLDPFNQVLAAATDRLLHDSAYRVIKEVDGYLIVLVKRNEAPAR